MNSTHLTRVLAFGPQSLSFDYEGFNRLHAQLIGNSGISWIQRTLRDLHTVWYRLISAIPILRYLDGEALLRSLAVWVDTGNARDLAWPLPNIILTPMTVVLHLAELNGWKKDTSRTQSTIFGECFEVLGLCTGLLSSAVVSLSPDDAQIPLNGAVAIRLAMLIGAVVDAKDLSLNEMDRAVSFAVHWSNNEIFSTLEKVVGTNATAYVSIVQDDHKATVTTSRNAASRLLEKLQEAGIVAVEIPLHGYFHWKGHTENLGAVIDFCNSNLDFRLNDSSGSALLVRSNETGLHMSTRDLHHTIIRSMLVEQSNWHNLFSKLQGCTGVLRLETFGSERLLPNLLSQGIPTRPSQSFFPNHPVQKHGVALDVDVSKDQIAVIGMACHLPGAADMDEFWDLLCSKKSQHVEVPSDRFHLPTPWRQSDNRMWYGNFVDNHDAFDNRFFKKSSREAASMDPQHRLMLQVAYQAVEQAGYLKHSHEKDVGCYISIGSDDYLENVACHPANAYSATGNLKAFAAGRISHYFGWSGPGFTVDSACSSSAVAIHLACQGILSGDCHAALVGGANLISGPEWYHNLAGASFLSSTGQCKPFDSSADGYCRGEAVGAVVLKRLSAAFEDGDQIFGIIAGSAVQQNQNNTAITVPNESSLSSLFRRVTRKAGIDPEDITYVEAHGTGTAVGDPAEYESIRRVFGGIARTGGNRLSVGSVKGLLGHAEAASGIVALLKIMMMLHHGTIPPQASFHQVSPALRASATDHMEICNAITPWHAPFRAALINNYGASGSNSSFVVLQPPVPGSISNSGSSSAAQVDSHYRHPFAFYGLDERALRRNTCKLLKFIRSNNSLGLSDISFQTALHSNPALRCSLPFSCSSLSQLEKNLETWSATSLTVTPPPRPVIICFGGQKSAFVGLDRQIYGTMKVFRTHLDRCNVVCEALGTTIFPAIFQKTAISDIVKLHTALFSLQYACGKAWIDCMPGVEIGALVGHSIGELSALCISGSVSLESMLTYIIGRAKLIRDSWGPDKGSMLSVEASLDEVNSLLAESARRCPDEDEASIACFNGQNSFTLAGSTKAIDSFFQVAIDVGSGAKVKRLNVTNAYHCSLVKPLLPSIKELSQSIELYTPHIHVESATERSLERKPDSDLLIDHFRQPVFFSHAVQRLAKRYPTAVWIEAGSNSGVTLMANRALDGDLDLDTSASHFQALNITGGPPMQGLAEATVALWREGVNVSFWPHHCSQRHEYSRILLPPYQFEKERHWMERKTHDSTAKPLSQIGAPPDRLWSFVSYQDDQKRSGRFRINTNSEQFRSIMESHVIGHSYPLCPSILQLEIAIDALMSMQHCICNNTCQPQLLGMTSHVPLLLDSSRTALLDAHAADGDSSVWTWTISSTATNNATIHETTTHVTGRIAFRPVSSAETVTEFQKFERLIRRERCQNLLNDTDVDDAVQGQRNIYRIFSDVVGYGRMFQGLRKIVGKGGHESAGRVVRMIPQQSWLDFTMVDCFCQVAGIFVNCMTERQPSEMYISDRIEQYIRSPHMSQARQRPDNFEVYACHDRSSDKDFLSDVFVFDSNSGALVEVIIGIHYRKISKTAFDRALIASGMAGSSFPALTSKQPRIFDVNASDLSATTASLEVYEESRWQEPNPALNDGELSSDATRTKISSRLKEIIASLSGLDVSEIEDGSDLIGLGIDSLMGMELSREIENTFKCAAHATLILDLPNFQDLVTWVEDALSTSKRSQKSNTGIGAKLSIMSQRNPQATQNGDFTSHNGSTMPITDEEHFRNMDIILQTFGEYRQATDKYIEDYGLAGYIENILPNSDALCVAFICDAFEDLGCPIRTAVPGQKLARVSCLPRNEKFVGLLWSILESRADLVKINELDEVIRTAVPVPNVSAQSLLQALNDKAPAHIPDHNLTALAGTRLADCIVGKVDCVQLLFGSPETRETVSAMYSQSPINAVWITQMVDFVKNVILKLSKSKRTIRILEIGAGTGGTTSKMISALANLHDSIGLAYTITDISPSLVAAAKKRFNQHRFVDCRVLDIEEEAHVDHLHIYDIVLATNCVHATRSLARSARNIRQMLRPNGFLLMLEMTETLAWVDLVFGLIEGWWLFNDGRRHALGCPELWEKTLHEAGFGRVDWTTGQLPESRIQRLILAMATEGNDETGEQSLSSLLRGSNSIPTDDSSLQARRKAVEHYVEQYTANFSLVSTKSLGLNRFEDLPVTTEHPVVLITGATGSLGSHLLQYLSSLPEVGMVICLNRTSSMEAQSRQQQALNSRDIVVELQAISKWRVFQTNTHQPLLGLSPNDYRFLASKVTHIIHNAWPMSIRRPINDFELQFKAMRNLIDLARDAHAWRRTKIGFQFVSSIAVVGLHPLYTDQPYVREEAVSIESVLPNGYGEAKLVCEIMLSETLQKFPDAFAPCMTVRIGQIAGSRTTGYWNPVEHFAFMVKSSQTLGCLPDLRGSLSWCPVNDVAEALGELVLSPGQIHATYHIENPARQEWEQMIRWLSDALGVSDVVPYSEWLARVCRRGPSLTADQQAANPAARLSEFLERHFERMSCGGLVLSTERSRAGSEALRRVGPVDEMLLRKFVRSWKKTGLLRS